MNQEPDVVQCAKCGKVREKFLVGCPKCGEVDTLHVNPNAKGYYEITPHTIQQGKLFYKKELTNEQKTFFNDRIPGGQSWQFYAGIILINNLNTVWLSDLTRNEVMTREAWDQPICCGNATAYYRMSFMTKEKQQNFCDLLNAFSHERIRDDKNKTNLQGEDVITDVGDSPV